MKKIAIILSLCLSLLALDIPLQTIVEIQIPIGNFTVLDFPFDIKGVSKATFIPKYHIKRMQDKESLEDTSLPPLKNDSFLPPPKKNKKKNQKKRPSSVVVKRGKNTLTIFPKRFGTLNLIVWGYKYPVLIKFKVIKGDGDRYFRFLDTDVKKSYAEEFEAVPHEKVITKLIRYLFNNKTPKGYDNIVSPQEYEKSGLHFTFVRSIRGKRYKGDEWIVQNISDKTIKLYEEMFYAHGVYAVALENDVIKPLEKVRLFIVSSLDSNSNGK